MDFGGPPGQTSAGQSSPFGQMGRIGRFLLGRRRLWMVPNHIIGKQLVFLIIIYFIFYAKTINHYNTVNERSNSLTFWKNCHLKIRLLCWFLMAYVLCIRTQGFVILFQNVASNSYNFWDCIVWAEPSWKKT